VRRFVRSGIQRERSYKEQRGTDRDADTVRRSLVSRRASLNTRRQGNRIVQRFLGHLSNRTDVGECIRCVRTFQLHPDTPMDSAEALIDPADQFDSHEYRLTGPHLASYLNLVQSKKETIRALASVRGPFLLLFVERARVV
jgi:hypothetical protein